VWLAGEGPPLRRTSLGAQLDLGARDANSHLLAWSPCRAGTPQLKGLAWLRSLRALLGRPEGAPCVQLDVLMDFSAPMLLWQPGSSLQATGRAAVRWKPLSAPPPSADQYDNWRVILAVLLYAKVLEVHDETRAELFSRVSDALPRTLLLDPPQQLQFGVWELAVRDPLSIAGPATLPLWPWTMTQPELIVTDSPSSAAQTRTCGATLRLLRPPSGFLCHLSVLPGGERVFIPASALIALTTLSAELDSAHRRFFGILLSNVQTLLQSADSVRLGSGVLAVAGALDALGWPQLRLSRAPRLGA
jgi:hypothetical protein